MSRFTRRDCQSRRFQDGQGCVEQGSLRKRRRWLPASTSTSEYEMCARAEAAGTDGQGLETGDWHVLCIADSSDGPWEGASECPVGATTRRGLALGHFGEIEFRFHHAGNCSSSHYSACGCRLHASGCPPCCPPSGLDDRLTSLSSNQTSLMPLDSSSPSTLM